MKKPLIIGSVHTDLIANVNSLPKGNEMMEESSPAHTAIGGTGFLSAYLYQGFGFDFDLIAPYGSGPYGDYVKAECDRYQISLHDCREEVSGCTYRMIDAEGRENKMLVPGCEYDFDIHDLDDIYPNDISSILVYSEMFMGSGADDLLVALEDMEKPIYLYIDEDIEDADEELLKRIYALKPNLIMKDTVAYYLLQEKYYILEDTAKALQKLNPALIMILKEGEGVYCLDEDDSFLAPEKDRIDPVLFTASYVLAENTGVDTKNAVMFASHLSSMTHGDLLDAYDFEEQKQRLTGMILHK